MSIVNGIAIRKSTVRDARAIQSLILDYSHEGKMMPRSLNEIYERIRSFFVVEERGRIVACCCLHVMWEDLAEIKSLAVAADCSGRGYGAAMIEQALNEARELLVGKVFVLTFIPEFFKKFGFHEIEMNELPKKIWLECVNCIHYPDCGETALIRDVE